MENLNRITTAEEYCLTDDLSKLDEVVAQYKKALRSISVTNSNNYDEEMAVLICNSICSNLDIDNLVVSIYGTSWYHFVLVLNLNNKYYVLDTNYKKYLKNANFKVHKGNMKEKFHGSPGFFILKSEAGRKFANDLVTKKYFACTEENMKLYCDSFVLARYNQNKKLKDLVYETGITGQEYLSNMVLKRIIDSKEYQKTR